MVYIQGFSHDNLTVKEKRNDGQVGVGSRHNNAISYVDGARDVELVKKHIAEAEEIENDADIDYDDEKDYQTESRTGSIARALNEDDDNGYCNFNVLPKGIENFFNSIDDIKKKSS